MHEHRPLSNDLTNIIHAAQRGDEHAFRQLLERHYEYVYRIAYRVLLNTDDARDAAQEVFIKVWRNIGTFNTAMNFTTWLYRIVANTALDLHRSRSRRPLIWHDTPDMPADATIEQNADAHDLQHIVRSLLGQLPPVQRLIFALRDIEDLPVADVAAVTGNSIAGVKTNLSYARRRMRELLAAQYDIKGSTP